MSFWQPRSVLQLVLVSFFAALAPLGVAMLFTVQTLGELTDKDREATRLVVEDSRLEQEIQRDVLELERRARQYLALGEPELAQLFETERATLADKLDILQDRIASQSPDINGLKQSLARLNLATFQPPETADPQAYAGATSAESMPIQRLNQSFGVISEQRQAVQKWLQASVDQLLEKNAEEADSLLDYLILQLLLLALVAFALLL